MENLTLDFNNFGSRAALGTYEKCDSLTLTIVLDEKDYAGYKFKIVAKKSDGHIIEQDIKEQDINREERIIKTELNNQFTTKEGVVKLEINMIKEGKEDTTKEAFFIVRDTINGEVVESTSIIPTLEGVKAFIDEAVISLGDLEQAGEDIALINGEFKENEIKRKANELLRERSEKERARLESIRTTEETDRIKAEAERKEAENNRKVAESNRKLAENTRKTNEAARVEAELNRQSLFEENEEIRNENENLRIASEKERIKFNSEAKTDELNRKEAEKNRVLAEEERKSSEESRVAAEAIRQNTYTDFNESEEERKSNEIKRQEAEALRVEAETRRDNLFSEKEEERNTSFIESEKVRNAAFNKAQDSRNTTFEESETIREEAFKISEKARNDAEELRVTAESERVKAEKLRVDSEKARVLAEEERNNTFIQKEEERNNTFTQNETNRNETFEVAEEARTVAETSRIESESSRVEAEKLRVAAETERVEAESLRVTAEEERVAAEQIREEKFAGFENKISANTKELKGARTATTGEEFNSLDERIDCEVYRLNKKIEVSMLQQESAESHVVENTVDGMTTDMVVKGRTLQNLMPSNSNGYELNLMSFDNETGVFTSTRPNGYLNFWDINNPLWKQSTQYTIILEILENTLTVRDGAANIPAIVFGGDSNNSIFKVGEKWEINILNKTGVFTHTFTTRDNFSELVSNKGIRGFVRDSFSSGQIKLRVMAIEGALESIPNYFRDIKSFGELEQNKISILSHGKNLFNNYFEVGTLAGGNTIIDPQIFRTRDFIKVKSNTKYVFSSNNGSNSIVKVFYDKNKKWINDDVTNSNTFTTPSNCEHIKLRSFLADSQLDWINASHILEEGTQATPYEPYKSDKKDILLQNLGFDEGLRGFDLTICDELNDIKNVAIKRVEKHSFTGNENISLHDTQTETVSFRYLNDTHITSWDNPSNLLCTSLPSIGNKIYKSNNVGCASDNAGFIFRLNKNSLTSQDVEGFKKWLKENPTTIYYELAEPVETPLGESINVKTFGERTYVSFENSISGTSNFKVPVDTTATITRLNRENRALEEENKNLRQDFESTTLTLTDSDLELVKQNVDMDFRLMEVEFALDIQQAILSSNIKFKNKKGEVKSMARTPYEMMKIVILSGDYDREDYIHKVGKYYERGRMTKEEHDELMSLMTADEVISK